MGKRMEKANEKLLKAAGTFMGAAGKPYAKAAQAGFEMVGAGINYAGARKMNKENIAAAEKAQQFSQESADKQMAFQEKMSNTSVQRHMLDLQAGGINPIYAFNQGASTPGGASAAGVAAQSVNEMSQFGNTAQNAWKRGIEYRTAEAELDKLEAETALTTQLAIGNAYSNTGKQVEASIDSHLLGHLTRAAGRIPGLGSFFRNKE